MDGPYFIQQYIQKMIRNDASQVQEIVKKPEGCQDASVWQYEQLRQVCLELNNLLVLMQGECSGKSCQEMKVGEWLFLCAAHPTPQSCSAMDYMVHTLDGATALLNSNKHFPSRVCIPDPSVSHFQSIMRRIYRNFAHAWFQHREIFIQFENETHLYERVVELCLQFNLMSAKSFLIPANYKDSLLTTTSAAAQDLDEIMDDNDDKQPPTILPESKKESKNENKSASSEEEESEESDNDDDNDDNNDDKDNDKDEKDKSKAA